MQVSFRIKGIKGIKGNSEEQKEMEEIQSTKIEDYAYAKQLIEDFEIGDEITEIGAYAFYNCREMKQISMGPNLQAVGSDAFMNCSKLHTLIFRGSPAQPGALQKVLAQLTGEVEVIFGNPDFPDCRILFPEYVESYDEIGPAHIFGRHIEGEGFRARQCFLESGFDFRAYDGIWAKAAVEEQEWTLCKMAANRLSYPNGLTEEAKLNYYTYVKAHDICFAEDAIRQRDTLRLEQLLEAVSFESDFFERAAELASEAGWAEGVAEFLSQSDKI